MTGNNLDVSVGTPAFSTSVKKLGSASADFTNFPSTFTRLTMSGWLTGGNHDRSFSVWVRLLNTVGDNCIFQYNWVGALQGIQVFIRASSNVLRIDQYINFQEWAFVPVPNVWTHIVGVYTAITNSWELFLDGVSQGSLTFGVSNLGATGRMDVGGDVANSAPAAFRGYMDALYFWDRVLTVTEITELYNLGNGKAFPFMPVYIEAHGLPLTSTLGFAGAAGVNISLPQTVTILEVVKETSNDATGLQILDANNADAVVATASYIGDVATFSETLPAGNYRVQNIGATTVAYVAQATPIPGTILNWVSGSTSTQPTDPSYFYNIVSITLSY